MDIKISLGRMYYPVKTLGPGNRIGIWLNGCEKLCEGCISPEYRNYDLSKEVTIDEVVKMIKMVRDPIDGFTISGGEPFYKPAALRALVEALVAINDDILIFSGYTLEELRSMKDQSIDTILSLCAVLIDGQYVKELNDNVGLRGSSNQRCWVFKYAEKYLGIDTMERKLQTIVYGSKVLAIGIPKEKH